MWKFCRTNRRSEVAGSQCRSGWTRQRSLSLNTQLEDRAQTFRGGIVRRHTNLLRLSSRIASTAAVVAMSWSSSATPQEAGLPTLPPVTAVGSPEVILTGLRPGRVGLAHRLGHHSSGAPANAPISTHPAAPAAPPASMPITATPVTAPSGDQFLAQLDLAIDVSSRRYLRANEHSPWQIFHGLLALKQDFQLVLGNSKVNAIEWIATSEPQFDGQPLLMKTPHGGKFHSFTRPYAFEGHPAQFLALLSQSDLPTTYRFKVGNQFITLGDIITNTTKEVNTREEVTWVLWGLQHYMRPDAQWVNQNNEPWSIERLVQIETQAPVVGAPCGGNHRLFALTRTRDKHLKFGGKLVGTWAQADYKIRQHIEIARSMQNFDGTFSSKFYETSGHTSDLNQRFNTTGHTMEFLSIALPNERLNEPWVRNAVSVLCNDLIANRQRQIDCGPLYHTLNSLMIYRERVRSLQPSTQPAPQVAQPQLTTKPVSTPSGAGTLTVTPPKIGAKAVAEPKSVLVAPDLASPAKPKPSQEALNELKLDGEFRERLNALTAPKPVPAIVSPDPDATPLDAKVKAKQADEDAPASALKPENVQ